MIGWARRRRLETAPQQAGISGRARVDGRTKRLLARVESGDVAVIDHEDIDRLAAEGLIQQQVAAVINASRSSTGRYPNLGPLLLCSAGVHLVDDVGSGIMHIPEGTELCVDGGRIFRRDSQGMTLVAKGRVVDVDIAEKALSSAKHAVADELERFVENTIRYVKDERDILLEAARLPEVRTNFHGRHVLVVVRGSDYKEDLAHLRSYVREVRPVLIGVDGGADALLDFGLKPDVIVGDMDSVTTRALACGAELVVHAYPGGDAPGLARVDALGLERVLFEAPGTSEDIAMLLAFERGAELIVAVGTHANLVEFMDKGRKGMASTFLTRLRVGPILVDAKGVSRLYSSRLRHRDLLLLVVAALVALTAVVVFSPVLRADLNVIWLQLQNLWFSVRHALFP